MTKQYAYLIKVEPNANNNKYYEMKENEDGTFTGYYGRVGRSPQSKTYPMSRWNSVYKNKLGSRKRYKDITHTRATEVNTDGDSSDNLVTDSTIARDIFRFLLNMTRENVSRNYLVPVSGVTQIMIDEAQQILSSLVQYYDNHDWTQFNKYIVELYMVIPRQMDNVANYILKLDDLSDDYIYSKAGKMISSEQDTLDSLKGQVVVSNDSENTAERRTGLFDSLGITVSDVDNDDVQTIKRQLGDISDKYKQAVRVANSKTEQRYMNWMKQQDNIQQRLLWHGSRNQNWISLLQKGLMLNPTNAIITGKMFGYGLYFAPRAKKSLGYTSLNGSYWANGNDSRGYMGLFAVHTGKVKRYSQAQSSLRQAPFGYDSVMGEKGVSLYNDEIIVYNEDQTTIRYLVDLR